MNIEQDILAARILIVDDQEANVQLLRRLLEQAGYTDVSSTSEPTEVCRLHRHQPYDLILLDLQMAGMDGFAVIEALKAGAADSYLSVMVLTAQPGHKLRALQAGAKDFVSKPFDLVEIKLRIHNLLEVRLLYRALAEHNRLLEHKVAERTAELLESEARFRALTELATDWYWEQDEAGEFTKVSGPALEMLGIRVGTLVPGAEAADDDGWDPVERAALQRRVADRQPFIDKLFHRTLPDGRRQQFRVSGQPMFDRGCRFIGYRGVGVEVLPGT
jgi:PAS domain S-box-containing protein